MDTSCDVFPRVVDLAPIVESISGTVLKDLPNPDASLPMKSNLARSERKGSNDRADTRASGSWAVNVYAIVGPDGAGKTTIARAIMNRLARRGVRTWIAWMRSPRIVTLGVLGITRLSKLNRTKAIAPVAPAPPTRAAVVHVPRRPIRTRESRQRAHLGVRKCFSGLGIPRDGPRMPPPTRFPRLCA